MTGIGVDIDHLGRSFSVGGQVLEVIADLSLAVSPGEFVALIGPSGCGKSTLLNLVAARLPPTTGRVTLTPGSERRVQGDVALAFQRDWLLEWRTALANLLLPAELRGPVGPAEVQRARYLLQRWGLGDFLNLLPAELSQGMRQRVAVCRALMQKPRLLLLDEPFAALDGFTREQIHAQLEEQWQEERMTVLMATHDLSEAVLLADRVILLSPRPARLLAALPIDLPRPRTGMGVGLSAPTLAPYVARIRELYAQIGLFRHA